MTAGSDLSSPGQRPSRGGPRVEASPTPAASETAWRPPTTPQEKRLRQAAPPEPGGRGGGGL